MDLLWSTQILRHCTSDAVEETYFSRWPATYLGIMQKRCENFVLLNVYIVIKGRPKEKKTFMIGFTNIKLPVWG